MVQPIQLPMLSIMVATSNVRLMSTWRELNLNINSGMGPVATILDSTDLMG